MLSRFNALVRNVPVVAACPHPGAVLRRDWHLEDAADDDPVLQQIVVVAPLARRAGGRRVLKDHDESSVSFLKGKRDTCKPLP
jgi:hypothetical protein